MGSNFANFERFRPLTYARAQLSLPALMGAIYVISRHRLFQEQFWLVATTHIDEKGRTL